MGKSEGEKGACSRKDTELSKGPGVKASEKRLSKDCCGKTELEQKLQENRGRDTEVEHIWLATLSPQ